jgi:hypothetical protein
MFGKHPVVTVAGKQAVVESLELPRPVLQEEDAPTPIGSTRQRTRLREAQTPVQITLRLGRGWDVPIPDAELQTILSSIPGVTFAAGTPCQIRVLDGGGRYTQQVHFGQSSAEVRRPQVGIEGVEWYVQRLQGLHAELSTAMAGAVTPAQIGAALQRVDVLLQGSLITHYEARQRRDLIRRASTAVELQLATAVPPGPSAPDSPLEALRSLLVDAPAWKDAAINAVLAHWRQGQIGLPEAERRLRSILDAPAGSDLRAYTRPPDRPGRFNAYRVTTTDRTTPLDQARRVEAGTVPEAPAAAPPPPLQARREGRRFRFTPE